jgi:signal transduction histidine kinase
MGERERAGQLLLNQTRSMALQVDALFARTEALMQKMNVCDAVTANNLTCFEQQLQSAATALGSDGFHLRNAAGQFVSNSPTVNAAVIPTAAPSRGAQRALQSGAITWSDFENDPISGKHGVFMYVALPASLHAARLASVHIPTQTFVDILQAQRATGMRVAAVLDTQGVLVARSARGDELLGKPASAPVLNSLAQQNEGILNDIKNQDGLVSIIAYARAPRSGFSIVTAVPADELYMPVQVALLRTLAVGTVLLGLALVAAYLIVQRIAHALQQVPAATAQHVPVTGLRETDALARTLATSAQVTEQAVHSKDLFLSTLSHALRTPLQTITGWTHFLKHPNTEPEMRYRAVQAIERSAHAQAQLLDYVTDMARLEAGRLQLQRQPVDLQTVVAAACEQVQEHARQQQVQVNVQAAPTAGLHVHGDVQRLQQVVRIMLHSAIQYTAKGGMVQVLLQPANHQQGEVIVTSQGIGLNMQSLATLFDVYAQSPLAQISLRTDCGALQRTLARKLALLHGGEVMAQQGTDNNLTFTLRLPLAVVTSPA